MLSLMEVYSMTDTTPLSPAAQAVLDAYNDATSRVEPDLAVIAAALRAAADQVAPAPCFASDDAIRDAILAIADELEGAR